MRLWKVNKKDAHIKNNRINLIIAIVFLLGGLIIYKLFEIQVQQYDLYSMRASNQYQSYNKLKPMRGKIYINDEKDITNNKIGRAHV